MKALAYLGLFSLLAIIIWYEADAINNKYKNGYLEYQIQTLESDTISRAVDTSIYAVLIQEKKTKVQNLKDKLQNKEISVIQSLLIVGFQGGAALLFILAGLMVAANKEHRFILALAIIFKIWTFFHIWILHDVGLFDFVASLEVSALNFALVAFEIGTFFISKPTQSIASIQGDLSIYKNAFEGMQNALNAQFPNMPKGKHEHVDKWVERIAKSTKAKPEPRQEDDNNNTPEPPAAPQLPQSGPRVNTGGIDRRANRAAKRAGRRTRRDEMSREDKIVAYNNFARERKKRPSSREMQEIWGLGSNATALKRYDEIKDLVISI